MQRAVAVLIGVFGVLGLSVLADSGLDDESRSTGGTVGVRLVAMADLPPLPRTSDPASRANAASVTTPLTSTLVTKPPDQPDPIRAPAARTPETSPPPTDGAIRQGVVSQGADAVLDELLAEISNGAVRFEFERSDLDDGGRAVLDRLAAALVARPHARIQVLGHTDSIGSDEANLRLSTARATAVVDHLTSADVDPAQLEVRAMGEKAPVAGNDTEQGRAENRRAEVVAGAGS